MKFLSILLLAGSTLAVAVTSTSVPVDTNTSVINWKGYKVLGSHEGTIMLKNGQLDMTDGVLSGGSFEIDMNSINCTDLTGEYKGKLEGHLKSDDFFGVASFPTASFVVTKVVSRGTPGDYKVIGDLTIKEATESIRFNVKVAEEDGQQIATGETTIDRSDFNIRYGSGSFFDNLGDNTIYDEFDLSFRLNVTEK